MFLVYAFFTPGLSLFTAFFDPNRYDFPSGNFPALEKNMDWMDGMAAAAIALLWLVTWGSVLGCVKLGARQ